MLALLIWLVYGSGYVDYDAIYALIWGDDLAELHRPPDLESAHSPTPHPLHTFVSIPLSLVGSGALDGLELLSVLSFAALGWFAFLLGQRLFGAVAGVALAALLLTRPVLVNQALTANIDIPFLALVLAALAMEARRPRRGWPVLVALAFAGLLRPEAWLLSLTYLAWLLWSDRASERPRGPRAHAREIALALSAPVVWTGFDLVLTGNPVHSLTHTSNAATRIGRPQGPVRAVRLTPGYLADFLTVPVVIAGVAAAVAALWLRVRRAYLPIVLGLLGGLGFLFLGFADLPLLARYLAVPSAMLALLVAGAVAAPWWWGRRAPAIAASLVALAAVIASIALSGDELAHRVDTGRERHDRDQALPGFVHGRAAAAAIDRCRPLQVEFFQTRPLVAYLLERRPNDIGTGRPERATTGTVLVSRLDRSQTPPPGFRVAAHDKQWTLYERCP